MFDSRRWAMASQFERDLKKAMEKAANDGVQEAARKSQRLLDGVAARCAGQTEDQVLEVLRTETRRAGWKATDGELRGYAQAISQGNRIVVRADRVRL